MTEEEKKYFTLVAVGFLRLMNARFREGVRGLTLDYAAREVLWKEGLDFNHGTGHGVGFLGVVHEGPQAIRFRVREESLERDNAPFAPGMVTSDEPGLYIEEKCGIRTENLLLCVPGPETAFGKFLEFEPLTLVPVDLSVTKFFKLELIICLKIEKLIILFLFVNKEQINLIFQLSFPLKYFKPFILSSNIFVSNVLSPNSKWPFSKQKFSNKFKYICSSINVCKNSSHSLKYEILCSKFLSRIFVS